MTQYFKCALIAVLAMSVPDRAVALEAEDGAEIGISVEISTRIPTNSVGATVFESEPLRLWFVLERDVSGVSYNDPSELWRPRVYEVEYRLADGSGKIFFVDRVILESLSAVPPSAPGTLLVEPGIELPIASDQLRVSARVAYRKYRYTSEKKWFQMEAVREASAEVQIIRDDALSGEDGVYQRIRTGLIRRHIVEAGRGLSWVWLKEYEAGADPENSLFNSRTLRLGDTTRIYVPWAGPCEDSSSMQPNCGDSVAPGADVIFGGDENPLLRGGIAMAALSVDALVTGPESLAFPLKLLEYFESSEWIDADGNPTGFFLRSRWPGNKHDETDREYFYASIDEIMGMTLGLYYLNEALEQYGDIQNSERVKQLAHRLGTQLKNNYYFIVPPEDLPQERHTGWSGGYVFQWYLAGGFRAITGNNYRPGSLVPTVCDSIPTCPDSFWNRTYNLPWKGKEGKDDRDAMTALVALDLSAADRAKQVVSLLGAAMYITDADPLFLDEPRVPRWNIPMLLHAFQLGMADEENRDPDVIDDIRVRMAALVLGILERPVGLKEDWTELISAAITFPFSGLGPVRDILESVVDLFLFDFPFPVGTCSFEYDYYAAAVALRYNLDTWYEWQPPPFLGFASYCAEPTGTDPVLTYRQVLVDRIARIQEAYAKSSPVGEPQFCIGGTQEGQWCKKSSDRQACVDGGGVCATAFQEHHNPNREIGSAFIWEKWPCCDDYSPSGDYFVDLGTNNMKPVLAFATHQRGLDAMREGSGLGYLWPTILAKVQLVAEGFPEPAGPGRRDAGIAGLKLTSLSTPTPRFVQACTTQPRYLADTQLKRDGSVSWDPRDEACALASASQEPDEYDVLRTCQTCAGVVCVPSRVACNEDADCADTGQQCRRARNDSYFSSAEIDWGVHRGTLGRAPAGPAPIYAMFAHDTRHPQGRAWGTTVQGTFVNSHIRGRDYDYFHLENAGAYDIQVDASFTAVDEEVRTPLLTVDGIEDLQPFSVRSRAQPQHTIMVTARNLATYELNVQSLPGADELDIVLQEDTPAAISLSGRDREGRPLTFEVTTQPAKGGLSGTAPSLAYDPLPNFYGNDVFRYRTSNGDTTSFEARVRITVEPVPDAPIAESQTVHIAGPTLPIGGVPITLTAWDPEGAQDDLEFGIERQPLHGAIVAVEDNGRLVRYLPDGGYSGTDGFTFIARGRSGLLSNEAEVLIGVFEAVTIAYDQDVETVRDTPAQITLAGEHSLGEPLIYKITGGPQHGSLEGAPGAAEVRYVPAPGFLGEDAFGFVAGTRGGDVSAEARVRITVRPEHPWVTEIPHPEELLARAKSGSVTLMWTSVPGADAYSVYRSTSPTGPFELIAQAHQTDYATYVDRDVLDGTTYYYFVRAIVDNVESMNSPTVAARPSARTRR